MAAESTAKVVETSRSQNTKIKQEKMKSEPGLEFAQLQSKINQGPFKGEYFLKIIGSILKKIFYFFRAASINRKV